MKFKKYYLDIIFIVVSILFAFIVESEFIHKEGNEDITNISQSVECDLDDTVEFNNSQWIKCNVNDEENIDYLKVTNKNIGDEKTEVAVVSKNSTLGDEYNKAVYEPFYNVDSLSEAVIRVDDELSSYDIYTNLKKEEIKNTTFESVQNDTFNFRNVIGISMVLIVIFLLIRHYKYFTNNIHTSYFLIALLFGISAVLLIPPLHAFDEYAHFIKAYDDNIFAFINYKSPKDIQEFISFIYDNSWFEVSNRVDMLSNVALDFENVYAAEQYLPFTYFPYSIGLAVASFFTTNLYSIYIAGKISGIVIYSLLGAYLIKYAKFFKKSMFILLLLPNVFISAISYSLDYLVVLSVLFLFSAMLNVREKQQIEMKDYVIICLSVAFIVFIKLPYFLITPIIFIVFKQIEKKQLKNLIIAYSISLIASLAITVLYVSTKGAAQFDTVLEGISVSDQIKFVISNPLVFIKASVPNFYLIMNSYFANLFQINFVSGIINFRVGYIALKYIWFIIPIFIITIFSEAQNIKLKLSERFALVSFVIIASLGVMGTLYLTYTPVGSNVVNGYQLRYFTPFIIMFMAAILPMNKNQSGEENIVDRIFIIKQIGLTFVIGILFYIMIKFQIIYISILILLALILLLRYLKSWIIYPGKVSVIIFVMCYVMLITQVYFMQYNL